MLEDGRAALEGMDRVLAGHPRQGDEELSAVMRLLAAQRRALLAGRGEREDEAPRDGDALDRLNAVIAVVMAAQFPIGPPPWSQLAAAREALAGLVEGTGAA